MARLAQLSTLEGPRGSAALAALLNSSEFLRFMEQHSGFELQGTDFDYFIINGTTTLQRRALAGQYTPEDKVPPTKTSGSLAFFGDSVDVDRSHRADEALGKLNIDDWLNRELAAKLEKWGELVEQDFFNGTGGGSPRQPNGLINLLDGTTDVPGFDAGTTMVIDAVDAGSGDSFDLGPEANWNAFLEAWEEWVHQVKNPLGVCCNLKAAARLSTIARVKHIIGESRDLFGRPQQTIGGVPIIRVPNDVIKNDEPDNNGTPLLNTTSFYIMEPGDGKYSIVTNSGLQFDDLHQLEQKESERAKFEMRADNAIQRKRVIRRIRNVKL